MSVHGQPGQADRGLPLPDHRVNETIDYEITDEEIQRLGLTGNGGFETIQHIELPESPVDVTNHRLTVYQDAEAIPRQQQLGSDETPAVTQGCDISSGCGRSLPLVRNNSVAFFRSFTNQTWPNARGLRPNAVKSFRSRIRVEFGATGQGSEVYATSATSKRPKSRVKILHGVGLQPPA